MHAWRLPMVVWIVVLAYAGVAVWGWMGEPRNAGTLVAVVAPWLLAPVFAAGGEIRRRTASPEVRFAATGCGVLVGGVNVLLAAVVVAGAQAQFAAVAAGAKICGPPLQCIALFWFAVLPIVEFGVISFVLWLASRSS